MAKTLAQQVSETRVEPPLKQIQISRKVRKAVALMVWDGASRSAAAEQAEMTDKNLYKALRLPKVKALYAQELKELREGGPSRAYINIMGMADGAKSEDVKLRSNQWIAGVDGLAPVTKVQGTMKVTHGFEGYAYPQAGQIIDGEAVPESDD